MSLELVVLCLLCFVVGFMLARLQRLEGKVKDNIKIDDLTGIVSKHLTDFNQRVQALERVVKPPTNPVPEPHIVEEKPSWMEKWGV